VYVVTSQRKFIEGVVAAFGAGTCVRVGLGGGPGPDNLKRIRAQPALIRGERRLACTYEFETKATHRNLSHGEIAAELERLFAGGFRSGTLKTTEADVVYERSPSGTERLTTTPPSSTAPPTFSHDRPKNYLIDPQARYLHLLDIADRSGKIRPAMNDKFRQVCKFIEVVSSLLKELPADKRITSVVDIGSGKSYLTFALYDYLVSRYGAGVTVRGVEVRPELVERSAAVAAECGFTGLSFVHAAGETVPLGPVDMVVALHACDTATDDALTQALRANAAIVVVAPCCHKYLRRQLVLPSVLEPALGHGILEARLADSLTDGLRALFLKAHGYGVKVFEFISPEHTAKNTMITAVRYRSNPEPDTSVLSEITALKAHFGFRDFYLDRTSATIRSE
jgi:protein-L-isoaspartate O-methyltransferase